MTLGTEQAGRKTGSTVVSAATTPRKAGDRILTVSNRGPFEFHRDDDGKIAAVPGPGGLATALRAAARLYPMTWLASPITPVDREIATGETMPPANLESPPHFVATDPDAYDLFYGCFANQVLWFLQHALPWPEELTPARREEAWWDGYLPVNQAFADAVIEEIDTGSFRSIMIHDYLFYAAPRLVRRERPNVYLQHFVHIPWPEPREWERLDRKILESICDGLLANDSLVFQTAADTHNFLLTCKTFLPGAAVDLENGTVRYEDGCTRVWSNGISVDPEELETAADSQEFSRYRWLLRGQPTQKTIIRVDRLDPTKNVVRGFEAYERLLEDHPELKEKVYFLALLVPSKEDIAAYQRYQEETHALIAAINRRFGNLHWKPIRVIYENNRMQAMAAMSLYDVLLVNPIADGMNLVAKEGPMLNTHEGALVLSTKAGAYEELADGAIGIDPEDVDATAAALYEALTLPVAERAIRARRLRQTIRQRDLRVWFRAFLADIEAHAPLPASSSAA